MSAPIPFVQPLGKEHVSEIVSVLCDAFADYPVMRYVLGAKDEHYAARLRRFVNFFAMARVLKHEPLLGIFHGSNLVAAALVSYPAVSTTSAELGALRAATWRDLGPDAEERYASYKEIAGRFAVAVPNIHLNVIGVRGSLQGTGLGRQLLEEVHRMAREDPTAEGVTLCTENPANVRFYERFGYHIVGHARVSPEIDTWGFFRPN